MPSKINASVSSGLVVDSDLTGSLQLQTGGNPAISIDSSQVTNFAKQFQIGGVLPPAFRGALATNLSVSNNTEAQISFNTEQFDTASAYSNGTFTVPVTGYYALNCFIAWSGDITGYWSFAWKVNGSLPHANAYQIQFTAAAHGVAGSDLLYLTAGQAVTSWVGQQSGGTKFVTAGGETFASIVLIRAA
jgi:hypothetical protein